MSDPNKNFPSGAPRGTQRSLQVQEDQERFARLLGTRFPPPPSQVQNDYPFQSPFRSPSGASYYPHNQRTPGSSYQVPNSQSQNVATQQNPKGPAQTQNATAQQNPNLPFQARNRRYQPPVSQPRVSPATPTAYNQFPRMHSTSTISSASFPQSTSSTYTPSVQGTHSHLPEAQQLSPGPPTSCFSTVSGLSAVANAPSRQYGPPRYIETHADQPSFEYQFSRSSPAVHHPQTTCAATPLSSHPSPPSQSTVLQGAGTLNNPYHAFTPRRAPYHSPPPLNTQYNSPIPQNSAIQANETSKSSPRTHSPVSTSAQPLHNQSHRASSVSNSATQSSGASGLVSTTPMHATPNSTASRNMPYPVSSPPLNNPVRSSQAQMPSHARTPALNSGQSSTTQSLSAAAAAARTVAQALPATLPPQPPLPPYVRAYFPRNARLTPMAPGLRKDALTLYKKYLDAHRADEQEAAIENQRPIDIAWEYELAAAALRAAVASNDEVYEVLGEVASNLTATNKLYAELQEETEKLRKEKEAWVREKNELLRRLGENAGGEVLEPGDVATPESLGVVVSGGSPEGMSTRAKRGAEEMEEAQSVKKQKRTE